MDRNGFSSYLRYCAGNSVALTCIWMQRVGVIWLAWEISESSLWTSIVVAAQLVPTIVAGPLFGAMADRVPIASAMIKVQLILASLTAILFLLAAADMASIAMLITFECLIGITVSAHQPLRMALVPALVPKSLMSRAISLDSMVFNLTRMIGPALAGFLIASTGVPMVIFVGAIGNLVLALVVWSLRKEVTSHVQSSGGFLSQLQDGWSVIRESREVQAAFLLTGVFGSGGRAAVDLFPLFAATAFDRGADGAGLLLSAAGLGAVCAAAVLALRKNLPKDIEICLAFAGFAALWAMSRTQNWSVGLACAAMLGCSASIVGVATQSKIQLSIPDGFHGRVMGLWIMMGLGSTALGTIIYGLLSDVTSLRHASTTVAILGILAVVGIALLSRNAADDRTPR